MACTGLADLAAAARLQTRILHEVSAHVRPGGLLVYATCSIARTENRAVAEHFLASQPGAFEPEEPACDFGFPRVGPGLAISPGIQDNDGFYVAIFRRIK
jgi:16S rRNA (cytosine967-C5)-methyltransferase